MLKLDHIALGTNDLIASSKTLSESLGVLPFGGGEHDLFGTHNKLWRIETPSYPIYLELIAANPNAEPKRPRWFGLGEPLDGDQIKLLTFIASTTNINKSASAPIFDELEVIDVSRGELRWKFGLTKDGTLLSNGALPYLIEWQGSFHPLDGVEPQGLSLTFFAGTELGSLNLDLPIGVSDSADYKLKIGLCTARNEFIEFLR